MRKAFSWDYYPYVFYKWIICSLCRPATALEPLSEMYFRICQALPSSQHLQGYRESRGGCYFVAATPINKYIEYNYTLSMRSMDMVEMVCGSSSSAFSERTSSSNISNRPTSFGKCVKRFPFRTSFFNRLSFPISGATKVIMLKAARSSLTMSCACTRIKSAPQQLQASYFSRKRM